MRNNTKSFTPSDKVYIDTPDTSSLSWRFSQRSDMQMRIYSQMCMRKEQNYSFYFGTLTYAPANRPYLKWYDDGKCVANAPCFSREHIHRFIRGVQMDLLKQKNVTDIDYIIACEFGKSGEFAPHYHFILMIPTISVKRDENNNEFRELVTSKYVHSLVYKHWSYIVPDKYNKDGSPVRVPLGFIFPKKFSGGYDGHGYFHKPFQLNLIQSESIIKTAIYVSKYCCKQIGFYGNSKVKTALSVAKSTNNKDWKHEFNVSKPFIKTSLHFGECLNDYLLGKNPSWASSWSKIDNTLDTLFKGFWCPLKRIGKTCHVPLYNLRKLIYKNELCDVQTHREFDVHGTSLTVFDDNYERTDYKVVTTYKYMRLVTELGEEYFKRSFDERILYYCNRYHKFRDTYVPLLNEEQKKYWYDYLTDDRIYQLAVYKFVYQYRVSPLHFAHWSNYPEQYVKDYIPVNYDKIVHITCNKYHKTLLLRDEDLFLYDTSNDFRILKDDDVEDLLFNEQNFGEFLAFPLSYGDETIDTLLSNARTFYSVGVGLTKGIDYGSIVPENIPYSVFFNSFKCFSGFDSAIQFIDDVMNRNTELKLKTIDEREKSKKANVDEVYKDNY